MKLALDMGAALCDPLTNFAIPMTKMTESNGEMICNNCHHYNVESPHGHITWPKEFYMTGRSVMGCCHMHEVDLFINSPCAAWMPIKEKQSGN